MVCPPNVFPEEEPPEIVLELEKRSQKSEVGR